MSWFTWVIRYGWHTLGDMGWGVTAGADVLLSRSTRTGLWTSSVTPTTTP